MKWKNKNYSLTSAKMFIYALPFLHYIELLQETIVIQGPQSTWYILYKLQTPNYVIET